MRHGFEEPGDLQDIRLVVDTIPTLAWSAGPYGSADLFNQRWLDYTGLSAKQALGWGWEVAIHPDGLNDLVGYWRRVVASGRPGEIEGRLRRSDGVSHYLSGVPTCCSNSDYPNLRELPGTALNPGGRMHKSRHQRCWDAAPILLCCLLSVLLSVEAYADDRDRTISQFQHTAWTAKVGAPGGIEALAHSRDGYLWLGTTNGLYRFDGLSFERIDPVTGPAFPSRGVCSFLALPNGDLWIGFRAGGISLLRAGVNTNYGASEG